MLGSRTFQSNKVCLNDEPIVMNSESCQVYSEVRKVENTAGFTIDLSFKEQKNKKVNLYLKNHSGVKVSISGEFSW